MDRRGVVPTFPSSTVRYVDHDNTVNFLAKRTDYPTTEKALINSVLLVRSALQDKTHNVVILASDEEGCVTTHLVAAKTEKLCSL